MRRTCTTVGFAIFLSLAAAAGCSTGGSVAGSSSTTSGGSSSGDGGGSTKPTKSIDICKKVTEAEVGAIVGGTVTTKEVPGGGCDFSQEDPRAASAGFYSTTYSEANGGFDGAKSGITSTIKGDSKVLQGIGERAFMVVGTATGGSSQQGAGIVKASGNLVQVTVAQSNDSSADDVTAMTTKLLQLVASKA